MSLPAASFNLPPGCRSRDTEPEGSAAGHCRVCDVELIPADHPFWRCNTSDLDDTICQDCAEAAE